MEKPVTEQEVKAVEGTLDRLSERLSRAPSTASPAKAKLLKHSLPQRKKPTPTKPLAIEMGLKLSGMYPNLYYRSDLGPEILFNAQGVMVDAPVCGVCNDAGMMKRYIPGRAPWQVIVPCYDRDCAARAALQRMGE